MSDAARFLIGIDLGTTNSSVSFVDTDALKNPSLSVQPFLIPQLTEPGLVERRALLPSFYYLGRSGEFACGALDLPFATQRNYCIGQLAKARGKEVPSQLVFSAKSWLCNSAANRHDRFLPFDLECKKRQISPIQAQSAYLRHIVDSWNALMAKGDPSLEMAQQDVVLTIPASFDEIARRLTLEAAQMAGLTRVTLLEEPQAAFYAWIMEHERQGSKHLKEGQTVLVCDVGGGTTDFSLISVGRTQEALSFQRIAVGHHLLLGGDNMDLSLAHFLEKKWGKELLPGQWQSLVHEARHVKELLLEGTCQTATAVVQSYGASVVAKSAALTLNADEVQNYLMDGFFPSCTLKEGKALKKSALMTTSLPYEQEPSILRHLAHFMHGAYCGKEIVAPSYVLFNGGAMKPACFRQAVVRALESWFEVKPQELLSSSLDLAVSRGAAYYGKVRRGLGVRIGGGSACGYYLSVDTLDATGAHGRKALTLLARGTEDGTTVESKSPLQAVANAPVLFRLYTSHTRLDDQPGDLVDLDPLQLFPLPPLQTVLRYGKKDSAAVAVPVTLKLQLTAIGTLDIWLQATKTSHRWPLSFQIRSAVAEGAILQQGERVDQTYEEGGLTQAIELLQSHFEKSSSKLMHEMELMLCMPKDKWPPTLLRQLFDALLRITANKKLSCALAARFWNLCGFFLRPGYGYPLDDWRIKELWKRLLAEAKEPTSADVNVQRWICYRRIAGGLSKGQQMQLFSELQSGVQAMLCGKLGKGGNLYHAKEQLRALASLELIDPVQKVKLGDRLVEQIASGKGFDAAYWALARLGARQLMRGAISYVVPATQCEHWIERLLKSSGFDRENGAFALQQMARKTAARETQLSDRILKEILKAYAQSDKEADLHTDLYTEKTLSSSQCEELFGDSLPAGLQIVEA